MAKNPVPCLVILCIIVLVVVVAVVVNLASLEEPETAEVVVGDDDISGTPGVPTKPPTFTFPSSAPEDEDRTPSPTMAPVPCLPDEFSIEPLDTTTLCANGIPRYARLTRLLKLITPENLLTDETTPQGMAYAFMLNYDPYQGGNYCGVVDIEQRYGLLVLYFSTSGDDWTRRGGWCNIGKHCTWAGVTCETGAVTKLELESNNLNGGIPDELYVLDQITEINLFANSLTGPIPESLKQMTKLTKLDFQQNLLTGMAFPFFLSNISPSLITSYKVTGNKLSGTIPENLENLSNLEELWAGSNEISGSIPESFGNLRRLKSLYLHDNELNGVIPTSLTAIPLEELWLSGNFFEEFPNDLLYLGSLTMFRLENNLFSGTLSTWIGLLTNLQDFRVSNNKFDGAIPTQLGLLTDLVELHIGENQWTGGIPNIFRDYKQLETFDVSSAIALQGSIPSSVFSVPTLKNAHFSDTKLSGRIPTSFLQAGQLQSFHLNDCPNIVGSIPAPQTGQLENLVEFLVQGTGLTGSMPSSICALREDYILDQLEADCLGASPQLKCSFPDCCTTCF